MSEYWSRERSRRVTAEPGRSGIAVAAVGTNEPGGGFLHARGELLLTETAASVLDGVDDRLVDVSSDPETQRTKGWLVSLRLRHFRYDGDVDLPAKAAELQDLARRRAREQGVDPQECEVALHYVLTGEGIWIPRGGPAHAPEAIEPVPPLHAWGEGRPVVAVVDTGLDPASATGLAGGVVVDTLTHQDDDTLHAAVPGGGVTATLGAEAGHGTFITYLVERLAGEHVKGGVRIAALRALDPDGFGTEETVVHALQRLRTQFPGSETKTPVAVVNLSLGGYTDPTDYTAGDRFPDAAAPDSMPLALRKELEMWRKQFPRTVFVAAAGNNGIADRPFWPAAAAASDERVVAVASLDGDLARSDFTNSGSWVSVSTLGEGIVSDYPTGSYPLSPSVSEALSGGARWSGTSFAAPVVAAEIVRRLDPVDPSGIDAWGQLRATLTPSADPGLGRVYDPRTSGPTVDPTTP